MNETYTKEMIYTIGKKFKRTKIYGERWWESEGERVTKCLEKEKAA